MENEHKLAIFKDKVVLGLIFFSGIAFGSTCFHANEVTMDAFTLKILNVCKKEFGIKLDYNKVHNQTKEMVTSVTVDCFNSCREGEKPELCMDRYKTNYINDALREMRKTMNNICINLK